MSNMLIAALILSIPVDPLYFATRDTLVPLRQVLLQLGTFIVLCYAVSPTFSTPSPTTVGLPPHPHHAHRRQDHRHAHVLCRRRLPMRLHSMHVLPQGSQGLTLQQGLPARP